MNRMPSRVLSFQTPLEVLAQHVQILSVLQLDPRVFGCVAYVHLHKTQRTKLDPCSVRCVFLGFHSQQKGYRCYHPSTRHMYVSMDVTLSETKYFFCKDQTTSNSRGEIIHDNYSHDNYSWIDLSRPIEFSSSGGETVQPNGQDIPIVCNEEIPDEDAIFSAQVHVQEPTDIHEVSTP